MNHLGHNVLPLETNHLNLSIKVSIKEECCDTTVVLFCVLLCVVWSGQG